LDEPSLFNATPDEMALFAAILGFVLAKPLTIDEQNVLGNVLFEAGEVLIVIAAQRTLLESIKKKQQNQNSNENTQLQIEQIQNQINQLQNQIDQLKQAR
jgi:hypothetical protein